MHKLKIADWPSDLQHRIVILNNIKLSIYNFFNQFQTFNLILFIMQASIS